MGNHHAPQRLQTAMTEDPREPPVCGGKEKGRGSGSFSLMVSFVLPQVQPKGNQRQRGAHELHTHFLGVMLSSIFAHVVWTTPKRAKVTAEAR